MTETAKVVSTLVQGVQTIAPPLTPNILSLNGTGIQGMNASPGIHTFKDFTDSAPGFGVVELFSLGITIIGVYIAFRWNESEKQKRRAKEHHRLLTVIWNQTIFRHQKIHDLFFTMLEKGKLNGPSDGQISLLLNYLPPPEQLEKLIIDIESVSYILNLKEQFEWMTKGNEIKNVFHDMWMLGFNLLLFERVLHEKMRHSEEVSLWSKRANLFIDLLYTTLQRFGVHINSKYKMTVENVDNGTYLEVVTPVLMAIDMAIGNKNNIEWNLSNELKRKITVSLYMYEVKIDNYDNTEVIRILREMDREKIDPINL